MQFLAATGTGTWSVTNLPAANLAPGQYLLVQQAATTTLVAGQAINLPTPDATGTIDLGTSDGKIALCSSTTALTGANPTGVSVVDFVGYGTTANAREPQAGGVTGDNAPALTTHTALVRLGCGGQDSNDNNADFAVGAPQPRNTTVAAANGITGAAYAEPYIGEPGNTLRLTATVYACGTASELLGATLVANATAIGGPASVTLLDDGVAPDQAAGDGVYCANVVIGAVAAGSFHLPVTYTNGAQSGASLCGVLVTPSTAPDNDNCATATLIPGPFPASAPVALTGATVESNPFVALGTTPTAAAMTSKRGVWYRVTGTGNTMTASLCASTTDTVIEVLTGTCDGLSVVAQGDDAGPACTGSAGSAAWCSVSGATYYVWVATFSPSASTLATTLAITDGGTPCTGAAPTTICAVDLLLPKLETEAAYGLATNDGCGSSPNLFTPLTVPVYPAAQAAVRGQARGYGNQRDSDWYRFTASVTDTLSVTLKTQVGALCELHELSPGGVCPSTVRTTTGIVARCSTGTLTFAVTAGTSYALRVLAVNGNAGTFGGEAVGGLSIGYELRARLAEPPANDACGAATVVAVPSTTNGSTQNATNDASSSCDPAGRDVWYQFTLASATTLELDTLGSTIDTVLTLYSACGAAETACNDDGTGCFATAPASSIGPVTLAAGTWRVRVSDKGLGSGGAFVLRIVTAFNDNCCGALSVACPSQTAGTTVGATNELAPIGGSSCTGPGGGESGQNLVVDSPGVWYRVNVPSSQTVYADTATAAYDTSLTVFTGACGALTCVTVNDDAQGTPFHSKVAWQANGGQDYFVLVHGFGATSTGTFTLNVTCDPTPSNDLCSNATVLTGTSGSLAGTLAGATGDNSTLTSVGLATCAPTYTLWDVWYSWTAVCDGPITLDTCGAWNTVLSVYSACPSGALSNEIVGTCNNDGPVGCAPGSQTTFAATAGTTYLVRVATSGAQTITGAGGGQGFTITWSQTLVDTDGDLTPDCFDGCPTNPALTAPTTFYADADGDTFGAGTGSVSCGGPGLVTNATDCDDGNAAVNPSATEVCNGIDDDCDVAVDEGLQLTFFADPDGDTFGNPNASVLACAQPSGFVPDNTDCNDTNAAVNPAATEVCNLIDDDCDTFVDEGVQLTFYRDADGDGFGDAGITVLACSAPSGFVANGTDCNDASAAINPAATELCDGIDNDCDASTDEGFDADGDNVADCFDNCPTDPNADQANADGDGFGDVCDNCPLVPNPLQDDCDGDSIGDACEGEPDCNNNGTPDSCDITFATSPDVNLNGVPDECEGLIGFCFGDGSQIPCPCANNGAPGHGCRNSAFTTGALLYGTGLAKVSADTLILNATSMTGATCVFFQGTATFPPVIVDDGIGCVGGSVIRLGTKPVIASTSSFPQGSDPLISIRGAIPPIGATRYYQCFYRNASAAFCPPATSNRTNGVAVTWIP
ncbi:MAG: pre-peptidase C-terminal domain-containing protein [Planctomycetes bacterium]|nr:pre-peptidase C-terminal domain-containing protein [Planctomycetota bacterium]